MMLYPSLRGCVLCACVFLAACGQSTRKRDVMDMYDLPRGQQALPQARDNDSYYSQPTVYKGCAVINDAPSCGGG